jgi:hypothetical protein
MYGIDESAFNEMYDRQGGKCAICHSHIAKERIRVGDVSAAVIDHDHRTNAVRGLLCNSCNMGIGNLKDSVDFLQSAIIYLVGPDEARALLERALSQTTARPALAIVSGA